MQRSRNFIFTLGPLRVLAIVFLALCPLQTLAESATPANLSKADKADISRIEAYLNKMKTMKSRFLQVSSDGDYSEGTVYFLKPGKMRLEYDKPSPVLIVSDGVNLTYYDKELKQVSYYDLDDTQAAALLRDHISFTGGDLIVTAFQRGPGVLRLTFIKGEDPLEGNLTLIFSDRPLGIKKWAVTDAQGITTNISLLGPRFGVTIDPEFFNFIAPDASLDNP